MFGDPFEVSTIRREDYSLNKCKGEYVDVIQCNSLPSSRTPRGHQFPGAFLNLVGPPFFLLVLMIPLSYGFASWKLL